MSSTFTHNRIRTPSRLHFTLVDMNGQLGRIDGGLGIALEQPGVAFDFRSHGHANVRGGDARLRKFVMRELIASSELLDVDPALQIVIRETIPPHHGLGSGTQWRLSLLAALNHCFELNLSQSKLTEISTRGGTSGIGIGAFQWGGLLLDGGHSVDRDKDFFAPSRFARDVRQPPLLLRYEFPVHWGVVLFTPRDLGGLSGQRELEFMVANTPIPLNEVQAVSHVILMQLLPAILELDLPAFGSSVSALQETGWKRRHWERPELAPLQAVRRGFNEVAGIVGCGLSSTGSTVFGFFDADETSDDVVKAQLLTALRKHAAISGQVWSTRANNTGMRLQTRDGPIEDTSDTKYP